MRSSRFLFFTAFSLVVFSQCRSLYKSGSEDKSVFQFNAVDEPPEYPGGQRQLVNDVANNFEYPEKARKEGIEGRMRVKFVISKDGKVENVQIERGVREDIDQAAINAVNKIKRWKPAVKDGKKVAVSYKLPINARLK